MAHPTDETKSNAQSILRAPLDQDFEVLVTNGVEEYRLGFPCRRRIGFLGSVMP
jgi:hypothetical protein